MKIQIIFLFLLGSFGIIKGQSEDGLYINSPDAWHSYKNILIVPIYASDFLIDLNKDMSGLITLNEALENNYVVISELNANREIREEIEFDDIKMEDNLREELNPMDAEMSFEIIERDREVQQTKVQVQQSSPGEVNTLSISNNSPYNVYLLAGDMVTGGKQDRVVAKDIIVAPGTKDMNLGVYCVEKRRWKYAQDQKNFSGYSKVISNTVRSSVHYDQDQGAIWSKVKAVQDANMIESETEAYADIYNSEELILELNEYREQLESKFELEDKAVGFIATTGDSILGCDVFCHPDLFRKQFRSLIDSYLTDVVTISSNLTTADQSQTHLISNKILEYFSVVKEEYFAPRNSDINEEKRFFIKEKVVHYLKLQ